MTDDSPDTSRSRDASPPTLAADRTAAGQRLDRFLRRSFPSLPQALVQKLLRKRSITVNRRRAAADLRLREGDSVELWTDLSEFSRPSSDQIARRERLRSSQWFRQRFRVLHEDEAILVLDKPAGIVVHPSSEHRRGDTLLDLVRAHLPELFERGSPYQPGFVHRLDRGTSGVIVAAKTRQAARTLENAFRRREVEKVYLALVHGRVRRDTGTVDVEIRRGEKPSGVTRYLAGPQRADPRRRGLKPVSAPTTAETRFVVEERFANASHLRIELGTGRTHQIRVHLASIGHPICGDGDYGDKMANRRLRERFGLERLFLHAAELEIPHPTSGERKRFRSGLPGSLRLVLERMRTAAERQPGAGRRD